MRPAIRARLRVDRVNIGCNANRLKLRDARWSFGCTAATILLAIALAIPLISAEERTAKGRLEKRAAHNCWRIFAETRLHSALALERVLEPVMRAAHRVA
jgi:hypothetical protein